MSDDPIQLEGILVRPEALTHQGAIATVEALRAPFAVLVECRKTQTSESVIFDVEVERPQTPLNDIRACERVAAVFSLMADTLPEVLVLRRDFPAVPHLNLRDQELPRSLCLYDQSWTELKRSWTGSSFIERVRWWLRLTARGELHGEDQPLEPLIFSHGYDLVVPATFGMGNGPTSMPARIGLVGGAKGRVIACWNAKAAELGGAYAYVMYLETPARPHGVIRRTPHTIAELVELVDGDGFSLLAQIRKAMQAIPEGIRRDQQLRKRVAPVFVLGLPKTRMDGGRVEAVETKAFISFDGVESVGVAVGAWVVDGASLGSVLGQVPDSDGSAASVVVANVVRELSPERAAAHSGLKQRDDRRFVAIGMGALGSQVAMNLARSGSGHWTLVDDDAFMPHNAVRHALEGGFAVGRNKAECVAAYINAITPSEETAQFMATNYLSPGDDEVRLSQAVEGADLVLDMSASVAVARTLADDSRKFRAASLFLSPSGQDLVMLAEDSDGQLRLDDLEMLYYKAAATRPDLHGHLNDDEISTRYGASCRDVSVAMNQASVGALAGIGAAAVGHTREDTRAAIRVWRMAPATLSVDAVEVELEDFTEVSRHGWRVRVSRKLFSDVLAWREERLPNETGGILIGGVDHARRCVHLVLALGSPPDSQEWPTMYIRGVKGLQAERERVVTATRGNLDYLGEWHSHPRGASTRPSTDDASVFEWICELAAVDDRPAIMLIVGEGEVRLFVAEFEASTDPMSMRP